MNARQLIENDRLGAWWKTDDEDANAKRQARNAEQSRLITMANSISKMEPSSRSVLDLVLDRDNLLKERATRIGLEAELKKLRVPMSKVTELIFREPGRLDNMMKHLGLGAAEAGDIIGVRVGRTPNYFSAPIKRNPQRR